MSQQSQFLTSQFRICLCIGFYEKSMYKEYKCVLNFLDSISVSHEVRATTQLLRTQVPMARDVISVHRVSAQNPASGAFYGYRGRRWA